MTKSIKYDVSEFNLVKYYILPEDYKNKKKQCYSICTKKNNKDEINKYYLFHHIINKSNKTSKLIYRFISEEASNNFIISEIKSFFKKHELNGKIFIYDEHKGYIEPKIINKNKIVAKKTKRPKTNIIGRIASINVEISSIIAENSTISPISDFHNFIKMPNNKIRSIKVSDINSTIYRVDILATPKLINSLNEEVDIFSIKNMAILDELNLKKFLEIQNTIKEYEQSIKNINKKIQKEAKKRDTLTDNTNIISFYDRSLFKMPYGALFNWNWIN